MDRSMLGKKSLNAPRPRVDRFVAPRASLPELRRRLHGVRCEQDQEDIWYTKSQQRKRYTKYIDGAFGLQPPKKEIEGSAPWPCVPRTQSYLSSADSILDLPSYNYAVFPELLDWSNENILVAALGRTYHKWSWRTQNIISRGFAKYEIHCSKFDPRGQLLALGTKMQSVEVHDNARSKLMASARCHCYKEDALCGITAVDWSPTGNSFVMGCSRGSLSSMTSRAHCIQWRIAVDGAVLIAKISPDARFVAAAAEHGEAVGMFSWPSLQLYSSTESSSSCIVKALTWHPWRSALLGIGAVSDSMHARFALWDGPTATMKENTLAQTPYSLDAMLFSHRTGELVISLWNGSEDDDIASTQSCSKLIVMSDLETVVDQWGEGSSGLDRVRTMVFSPDGTKLATATSDEDLIIWNFLPDDGKKKKTKRFSDIPEYLDKTTHGISIR